MAYVFRKFARKCDLAVKREYLHLHLHLQCEKMYCERDYVIVRQISLHDILRLHNVLTTVWISQHFPESLQVLEVCQKRSHTQIWSTMHEQLIRSKCCLKWPIIVLYGLLAQILLWFYRIYWEWNYNCLENTLACVWIIAQSNMQP